MNIKILLNKYIIGLALFTLVGLLFVLKLQINPTDSEFSLKNDEDYKVDFKTLSSVTNTYENITTFPEIMNLNNKVFEAKFNSEYDQSKEFELNNQNLEYQAIEMNKYNVTSYPPCKPVLNLSSEVTLKSKRYLSIKYSSYEYSCGAHGNRGYYGKIFDIKTGKILSLGDLFVNSDYLNNIYKIVREKLCKLEDFKAECAKYTNIFNIDNPNEGWLLKGTYPSKENYSSYYLKANSIVFVLNQYQISSYANRVVEVDIPFTEIKDLLALDFN